MTQKGLILHAKHAFMPNNLGFCGPDENGRILESLEGGSPAAGLVGTLQKFEAAYPFLKLIARATGKEVFDYEVPEAYWIGNELLERVPVADFYRFSHRELAGRDPRQVAKFFRSLEGAAFPHHTFYVLGTFASSVVPDGPSIKNEKRAKVVQMMDSCRVSWGAVRKVGNRELKVVTRPLAFEGGAISLAPTSVKRVQFNPEVRPFQKVKPGDVVSLHWNYACDVLNRQQVKRMAKYTSAGIATLNRFLSN